MSSGELLLTLVVALIVFGPKKLPMLATHLGLLLRKTNQLREKVALLWHHQLNELQLKENLRKAELADDLYKREENQTKVDD